MNYYQLKLYDSKKTILILIGLLVFSFPVGAHESENTLKIIAGPYQQHVTKTSIVIMWETNQPTTSIVEFGKNDSVPLEKEVMDTVNLKTIHEIKIEGLKPENSYFYRVISENEYEEVSSEVFTFKAAVYDDSPFSFVVMGDNRTYPERFSKIAEAAYAERPDFVINAGDVVTKGYNKEEWIDEFLKPAAELMRRVPTYIAIGNHERDAHWYYDYVSYPQLENYYSFDYGNAHFTIIDSNKDLSLGNEQYEWLNRDLSHSNATWKFIIHHHPVYSTDDDYGNTITSTRGDENVRKLIPLYQKYRIDIVWYGHIHDYERTWPIKDGKVSHSDGVIYIQTGGGGAPLEDYLYTRSWFTAKVKRDWHYCLVTISNETLRMMAYDIEGRMFDFFKINKEGIR